MSHLLFHDGHFVRDDQPLAGANNRGLRYGDGLFETMKVNQDRIQLLDFHMERFFKGIHLLGFQAPSFFQSGYLAEKILQLAHRNGHAALARIRLSVYRGDGGPFDPVNHYPHNIIQSWPLPATNHEWNETGLQVGWHELSRKAIDGLSNCKTNNYLPYLMAARSAKEHKWNDAILLNTAGRVCESSIANIFILKDGRLITPALSEGPVAGTLRRYIIEQAHLLALPVEEKALNQNECLDADELFLSNASFGMRWVASIGKKTYGNEFSRALYERIIRPLWLG